METAHDESQKEAVDSEELPEVPTLLTIKPVTTAVGECRIPAVRCDDRVFVRSSVCSYVRTHAHASNDTILYRPRRRHRSL